MGGLTVLNMIRNKSDRGLTRTSILLFYDSLFCTTLKDLINPSGALVGFSTAFFFLRRFFFCHTHVVFMELRHYITVVGMNSSPASWLSVTSRELRWPLALKWCVEPKHVFPYNFSAHSIPTGSNGKSVKLIDDNEPLIKMENDEHKSQQNEKPFIR